MSIHLCRRLSYESIEAFSFSLDGFVVLNEQQAFSRAVDAAVSERVKAEVSLKVNTAERYQS